MMMRRLLLKLLVVAVASGIVASLATGLYENRGHVGIPENKYYGYPLVWRVTSLDGSVEYSMANFALNFGFWFLASFLILFFLWRILFSKLKINANYKTFLLPAALFIPLGLIMDFVHEFGHAMWGTLTGGSLTYMQIAYFQVYPKIAVTSHFALGLTAMDGLVYGSFEYGLMLLGGSMTTNIFSWILALIPLKTNFGNKEQTALKILGFFGAAYLPFYIVFPQIGLNHWILLGGSEPEPLVGARMMGIPTYVLYTITATSTIGLILLYSKSLREKLMAKLNR
ncbi:MAG: hypothetical protein ACUVT9_00700 [Candidatus Bathycorpusculaceae bacterium]